MIYSSSFAGLFLTEKENSLMNQILFFPFEFLDESMLKKTVQTLSWIFTSLILCEYLLTYHVSNNKYKISDEDPYSMAIWIPISGA